MPEPAEAGEAHEHHRPGGGFWDGWCKRRDADRAVAAVHARFQDLIGELARKVGAAAARAAAAAAAAGHAGGAAIGECPAEPAKCARVKTVAPIPDGAYGIARATAAAHFATAGAAGRTHAANTPTGPSSCSAAASRQSGTADTANESIAAPAAPAGDGKERESRPIEETAAAAAAAAEASGSALPADNESQILSGGEENVAGNLSAKTANIPSAGAEKLDRIFAADRGGEALHRSGKRESFGVRLGR
jgi:hypothetical protein